MHTHYIIIVADVYLCKIKTQLRLVASMTALLEVFFFNNGNIGFKDNWNIGL